MLAQRLRRCIALQSWPTSPPRPTSPKHERTATDGRCCCDQPATARPRRSGARSGPERQGRSVRRSRPSGWSGSEKNQATGGAVGSGCQSSSAQPLMIANTTVPDTLDVQHNASHRCIQEARRGPTGQSLHAKRRLPLHGHKRTFMQGTHCCDRSAGILQRPWDAGDLHPS